MFGGNIGPFSGSFYLWSILHPAQFAVRAVSDGMSGTSVSLTLEGVADTSVLGATSGPRLCKSARPDFPGLSMTVPGIVGLSPGNTGLAGGTYFTAPGVFVQNNLGTPLAVGSFSSSAPPCPAPWPRRRYITSASPTRASGSPPWGRSEPGQHRGLRLWRRRVR